jgi:electron transport complex protein RnfB
MEENYYTDRSAKLMRAFRRECEWARPHVAARFGNALAPGVLEQARSEFASLIPRIPYLGGSENHMTSDLVESVQKLALLRSFTRQGATAAEAGALIAKAMETRLSKYPRLFLKVFGRLQFTRRFKARIRRQAQALRSYPNSFVYDVIDGNAGEFDWGIDFKECAIKAFYEAQGASEFMPYVCALDYALSDAFGLGLERGMTLAEGGDRCNPRMKRGRATVRRAPVAASAVGAASTGAAASAVGAALADPFARLADALDRLPNGYPRTDSGIELRILKKIFTPEEAATASLMRGEPEPFEAIARRAGAAADPTRRMLMAMAKKGLVWPSKGDRELRFRLAPFIVGIYEASLPILDHELAHLIEDYMAQGGVNGIMKAQPALHRVLPARGAAKTEWILPYDDVKAIILAAKSFQVRDCICRVEHDLMGDRKCTVALRNCLSFSTVERPPRPDDITREQALAILDESEEAGLVHTASNVVEGVSYVCNCCGCCCGILRGVTEYGVKESVARANYVASIDPALCTACGRCVERCQVGAITVSDAPGGPSHAVVAEACIGCGLCVTGCAAEAATLSKRPDAEQRMPPSNYADWEKARLLNRGLDRNP